jgi:hypothetical protein
MKTFLFAALALTACTVAAPAITVTTPANGAQVTSPFLLVASTTTCGSVPAVSMGYSVDSGASVIELTSFSAYVSASAGTHVLHVKCWGEQANSQVLLNINVVPATGTSNFTIATPANGAAVTSPFLLTASISTCDSVPAVSMGYSVDSGAAVIEPTSFSAYVTASVGTHVLHVKCWGQQANDQKLLSINVVAPPPAATPAYSLASGTYTSNQIVAISSATAGSTIYYTVDGSAPSTASPRYTGPISVDASVTIEAMAVASGYGCSGLARADYVIKPPTGPTIPSNAISQTEVQTISGWRIKHDPGTSGTSVGAMTLVSDPSLSGQAQQFDTSYTDWGGELYSLTYGNDTSSENFVYDAEVWIEEGSQIGNLEMDNNQVMANGDTVIYAFQCAGDSNTWDYTENAGTPAAPIVKWVQSSAPCNPANWTPNAWHHVQISYSRDDSGNVTYQAVWLDGIEADINETVNSEFSLGWALGTLITNFQVDGVGASGSSTLYLDELTISRW